MGNNSDGTCDIAVATVTYHSETTVPEGSLLYYRSPYATSTSRSWEAAVPYSTLSSNFIDGVNIFQYGGSNSRVFAQSVVLRSIVPG